MGEVPPAALLEAVQNVLPEFVNKSGVRGSHTVKKSNYDSSAVVICD